MSEAKELYVAVDVDVQETTVMVVNAFGQLMANFTGQSESFKQDRGIKTAVDYTKKILADHSIDLTDVKGIGISAPTLLISGNNSQAILLPFLFRAVFEKEFPGLLVRAADDVTLSALGEHHHTYKDKPRSLFFVNWGNGIGGGMMVHGRVWPGTHGIAGNFGHIAIRGAGAKCWCGNTDCINTFAAGELLPHHYFTFLDKQKPKDYQSPFAGKSQKDVTVKMLAEAAAHGDVLAQKVFDIGAMAIAKGLVSVINIMDPEVIVIGGRVVNILGDAVKKIEELTKKELMYPQCKQTPIVESKFANASTYGAFQLIYANVKAAQGKKTGKALKAIKK